MRTFSDTIKASYTSLSKTSDLNVYLVSTQDQITIAQDVLHGIGESHINNLLLIVTISDKPNATIKYRIEWEQDQNPVHIGIKNPYDVNYFSRLVDPSDAGITNGNMSKEITFDSTGSQDVYFLSCNNIEFSGNIKIYREDALIYDKAF